MTLLRISRIAAYCTLFLAITSATLVGQATPTTPVAVIDIGYIFKNNPRFTQAMDRVKQEVKLSEEAFRQRAEDVQARSKQLEQFKPDSAEHKNLLTETARLQAQVQADMTLKRKEFLEKEALVYHAFYQELQTEVQQFADNHGIGLVLRFSADKMDPSDRQSVLEGVNRPVVYQSKINITYDILDRLVKRGAATQQRTADSTTRATQRSASSTAPRRN